MQKYTRIRYQTCKPLGQDGRCVTGSEKHIKLSYMAATEGMVLLKNQNKTLPLEKGARVALFGQASLRHIKGGGGSGDVYCKYVRSLYDGLKIKSEQGKVSVFEPLIDFYEEHLRVEEALSNEIYERENPKIRQIKDQVEMRRELTKLRLKIRVKEADVPDELFDEAVKFTDTAIVSFNRTSRESSDRSTVKGDYYLDDGEYALIKRVKSAFKYCIVVLNVGGIIDTDWFANDNQISSVLLSWQAGMEGGLAAADILCGDVNPSGKLTDTFAKSFNDYPSSENFNDSVDYVDYNEDIYVGYRYFETIPSAFEKVNYPFGFGLSYTTFKLWGIVCNEEDGVITATVNVTNTGDIAGKEVVQVYYSAPQGLLGKPALELAAFAKTKLLAPNETQTLALNFKVLDMASFDDLGKIKKSAYVLEAGDYNIFIGNSVRNTVKSKFVYTVKENAVTEQLTSRCKPVQLKKRMLADGSYEELPLGTVMRVFGENKPITAKAPEMHTNFDEVGASLTLDEFIAQFTDDELCEFMGGSPNIGVSNTSCFSGLQRLSVPSIPTADGPAGLRLKDICSIETTAWPCATLLACSWNTDIVEKIGAAGAKEVKENNLAVWLTPALNIHRNPLCGRNFEYFSEDPLVSGKMAAAKVKGIQSQNIACSIKHFACNNKEINRKSSDSRVSERALREIYLKGFEICVKEADPWTVMTSYNLLNGINTCESYDLITGILRGEWGFNGMVTTDWNTLSNQVYEVKAGNDMKMPVGYPNELKNALLTGELTRADLEACAKRVLTVYLRFE